VPVIRLLGLDTVALAVVAAVLISCAWKDPSKRHFLLGDPLLWVGLAYLALAATTALFLFK
jgi:hypothetical protein